LTFIILTLTLFAIGWYSIETRWLRQEMAKQTELQIRPFLILSYDQNQCRMSAYNIGQGIARQIQIPNTELSEPGQPIPVFVRWREVDHIGPGRDRELDTTSFLLVDGVEQDVLWAGTPWMANFGPSGSADGFEIPVSYANLVGTRYETTFRVRRGRVEVLRDRRIAG
jgi:hypothetical protein